MARKLASASALGLMMLAATGSSAQAPAAATYGLMPCPGLDASTMRAARAQVERLFADHPETRGVQLMIDDCVSLRAYAPGWSDGQRFISWSMAKTITAMLIGELVSDGRLNLDAEVPLAEWRGRGITLRHMLHITSGVRHIEVGDTIENSDTNQTEFVHGTAAMAAAGLAQPREAAPGTRFEYNTLTSILLSEIITRTLTQSRDPRVRAAAYRDFADERLFRPAGVTSAFMEFDGAGTQIGGSLIHMTMDDWARMGALMIDGRNADGVQVIAPDWLAFMATPSPRNAEYGGHVWLNRRSTARTKSALFPGKGPDTVLGMNGHLGQLVIAGGGMVDGRRRRMVLVRLGNTPDGLNAPLMATMGDLTETVLPRSGRTTTAISRSGTDPRSR